MFCWYFNNNFVNIEGAHCSTLWLNYLALENRAQVFQFCLQNFSGCASFWCDHCDLHYCVKTISLTIFTTWSAVHAAVNALVWFSTPRETTGLKNGGKPRVKIFVGLFLQRESATHRGAVHISKLGSCHVCFPHTQCTEFIFTISIPWVMSS